MLIHIYIYIYIYTYVLHIYIERERETHPFRGPRSSWSTGSAPRRASRPAPISQYRSILTATIIIIIIIIIIIDNPNDKV